MTGEGASGTADEEVVGREEELQRVSDFIRSNAGLAAALVVQGEAGIGKTTVLRAAVRQLESAGFRVLRTTPTAAESSLPLCALTDLLEPVYGQVRTELPSPQRRALDVALALEEPHGASESERLLRAATLTALRSLADLGPLVVAVDDAQWMDPESASALTFALRRLRAEPVLFVFALRLGAHSVFDVSAFGDELHVERLTVGPLSLGATQRMLLSTLGVTYPRPIIRRLVETSGGNPFYALELARGVERTGAVGSDEHPALSQTLEALVAERIDGVSELARRLLGLLSLVPDASVRLLEKLDALDALDEVASLGIVRVEASIVRFDHPLLAVGAHARLGPEERRKLHAELASALEDPVERARHLARSANAESEEVASGLAAAAAVAAGRGQPKIAADLAGASARLTPQAATRDVLERRLLEARCLAQAGSFESATAMLRSLVEELAPGEKRSEALSLLARATGDIEAQRSLLLDALAETREPAIAAEANALLVRNYLYSGELAEALAAARTGYAQARATGDDRRIAAAVTTLGLMQIWGTGAPDADVLERARVLAASGRELPVDTYSNPHTLLGARCLYRYEVDKARASYLLAAEAAEVAGEIDSLETFWWGLAQLEVRAGRYQAARECIETMRDSGEAFDRRPMSLRWIEGVLATYEGHVDEAGEALEETLTRSEAGENWFFVAYARAALGFLELSLGKAVAAVAVLEPVLSTPFVVEGDPGQTGILPLAAEALLAAGEPDRAAAVVDLLESRGRELEHPWCLACACRCRGLLLAERRELDAALRSFEAALELHDRVPAPFERARTVLALGSIQRRARQRRDARRSLEDALARFDELGTPLWAERARAEIDRIGGRAPSRGELTPNELRIATLVAEGKTNKEVAGVLFVTDRTVESALTQIYRKLHVRSRTELARKLGDA